jgi:hypothetical protein
LEKFVNQITRTLVKGITKLLITTTPSEKRCQKNQGQQANVATESNRSLGTLRVQSLWKKICHKIKKMDLAAKMRSPIPQADHLKESK